ncbi:MAG: hypothetical protein V4653_11400 [Pseudomonadota bacterium]
MAKDENKRAKAQPGKPPTATPQGAPTDEAHQRDGDGTLQGSVPAGLTAEQLHERSKSGERDSGGTG